MSGLGTDVVALACILGGAAVGGAVTLAALNGGAHEHDVPCAVEVVEAPRVVVSAGGEGEHLVFAAPQIRVHAGHGCEAVEERVRHRMEMAQERMQEAQVRIRRAQERMVRTRLRLRRVDGAELERARKILEERQAELASLAIETADLDAVLARLDEAFDAEVQMHLQMEMQELAKRLERLDDEIGR